MNRGRLSKDLHGGAVVETWAAALVTGTAVLFAARTDWIESVVDNV